MKFGKSHLFFQPYHEVSQFTRDADCHLIAEYRESLSTPYIAMVPVLR